MTKDSPEQKPQDTKNIDSLLGDINASRLDDIPEPTDEDLTNELLRGDDSPEKADLEIKQLLGQMEKVEKTPNEK